MLVAAARRCRRCADRSGHRPRRARRTAASGSAAGWSRDVLVISGGVSAGVLDLVPSVLAELGVERAFSQSQSQARQAAVVRRVPLAALAKRWCLDCPAIR